MLPETEDVPSRKLKILAVAVLLLLTFASACMRFSGIGRHYPYMNYVDEGHIIRHAQNMYHAKTLDPHWYQYSAGMMHLTNLGVWGYVHLTGQQENFRESVKIYPHVKYFGDHYPHAAEVNYNIVDPPIFLLIGRILVALAGSLSVLAFYAFVRQATPAYLALAASFLFAILPGIIQHSYFVNNDIPMLLLFCIMLWMLLSWYNRPVWWRIALAGFCVGAASSFKMSGILYGGLPFLICISQPIPLHKRFKSLMILCCSCVVGAYTLHPGLRGIEMQVFKTLIWDMGYYARHATHATALEMLLRPSVLGATMLTLGGGGLVVACFDRHYHRFAIACLLWLIPFFWVFLRYDYQPVRNLYPIAPLLVFFAVWAVWRFSAILACRRSRLVPVLAVVIMLLLTGMLGYRSVQNHLHWQRKPNARILVAQWLEEHAPRGATIAVPDGVAFSPWVMRKMVREQGVAFCQIENLSGKTHYLSTDYVILPKALTGKSKDQQPLLEDLIKGLKASGKEIVYTSPGKGGVDLFWGYYHYSPIKLDIWSQSCQQ